MNTEIGVIFSFVVGLFLYYFSARDCVYFFNLINNFKYFVFYVQDKNIIKLRIISVE